MGEESHTIEDVYEPFLLQRGFIQRTPRGRVITERGRAHLGAAGYSVVRTGELFVTPASQRCRSCSEWWNGISALLCCQRSHSTDGEKSAAELRLE